MPDPSFSRERRRPFHSVCQIAALLLTTTMYSIAQQPPAQPANQLPQPRKLLRKKPGKNRCQTSRSPSRTNRPARPRLFYTQ